MSKEDREIKKLIDALDAGVKDGISEEVRDDHNLMIKGIQSIGEEQFKEKLKKIHAEMRPGMHISMRAYWISGIAAALMGAFFWWQSMNPKLVTPELQMQEAPVYGDSANYDSLKIIEPTVDKNRE